MDNFYLWIILVLAVVLLVFMWRKASKTSKEHYRRQEKLKQQLIHQAELKRDFEELTKEKISLSQYCYTLYYLSGIDPDNPPVITDGGTIDYATE